MPTPFMHLVTAERLLRDEAIDARLRDNLQAQRGAFLLGNIAPDARHAGGVARALTHFFHCDTASEPVAWATMLDEHPALRQPHQLKLRAFVAGYIAHLAMDVVFCRNLAYPHFIAFAGTAFLQAARAGAAICLLIQLIDGEKMLCMCW